MSRWRGFLSTSFPSPALTNCPSLALWPASQRLTVHCCAQVRAQDFPKPDFESSSSFQDAAALSAGAPPPALRSVHPRFLRRLQRLSNLANPSAPDIQYTPQIEHGFVFAGSLRLCLNHTNATPRYTDMSDITICRDQVSAATRAAAAGRHRGRRSGGSLHSEASGRCRPSSGGPRGSGRPGWEGDQQTQLSLISCTHCMQCR